jgi:ketopantoate hydroxymethyltransferase
VNVGGHAGLHAREVEAIGARAKAREQDKQHRRFAAFAALHHPGEWAAIECVEQGAATTDLVIGKRPGAQVG